MDTIEQTLRVLRDFDRGVLTLREALEQNPFVDDVDAELARLEKERQPAQ
jgi:hypothetical protein